jgi:hypothetical protein
MTNVVKIRIWTTADQPDPTLELPDVPWYAGITALHAMIIGEALHADNFSFRVIYRSIYGAFIDSIDGLADEDQPNHYWMIYINDAESKVGVSEAILLEDDQIRTTIVDWKYVDITKVAHPQVKLKTKPLR